MVCWHTDFYQENGRSKLGTGQNYKSSFAVSQILKHMGIIFLLIGLSLFTGVGFLAAFFWAFGDGQFNDTTTPGMRILDLTESQKES